ncbi:MAG: tRNA (N6-isopentenyl adenosine(37)-C2)-methylthiotransferase MiaB [Acidobacteriota bacterium]|nr:tRNA (N6-isopentenyl adenosine(37)-C2)-methylthiotransferase MiaB [Acidobacteriota bacterium]
MSQKYLIETFGCQMNVHDSERMAGLLEQAGYEPTDEAADADVIVINTCSVREHAEEKLYTRLGELRVLREETGHDPIVAVAGCVAQQEGEAILTRSREADLVVGTQAVRRLPMLVQQAAADRRPAIDLRPTEDVSFPLGVARRQDPVKAYVTIIEGCNDCCAFCVVPYTRGAERMRPRADIVAEVREAVAGGRKEVQLLGQIVNHYQAPDDPACDFAGLLEAVHEVPGLERIRFASPHPRHVSARLIEAVRDLPKVCKHLHLPVQSGSTRVLQAMRRRYSRESYLELVARIREAVPGIALSTDMIVGFPGESVADFEQTLSLTEAVGYHSMFSFKYSVRPRTLASRRMPDDVPEAEKTRRIVELQARQRDIQSALHARMVGQVVDVLVDAVSRRRPEDLSGRTSGNTVVNLTGPAAWIGRTLPVRIRRAGPNSLSGEALPAAAAARPSGAAAVGLTGSGAAPRL